jgi:hypothetical protein
VDVLDVYTSGCTECVLPTPTPTPTPAPDCYCYTISGNSGCTITWTGCSGNSETTLLTGDTSFSVCAQENSISFSCITGTTSVVSGSTCSGDTECQPPTPIVCPSGTSFVFTSCSDKTIIVQTACPPTNINVNDILKTTSGLCYTYIGNFVNYVASPSYIIVNANIFTATTATTYTTCLECLTPPPTPTPTSKLWRGSGEYSLACPVCELTDFGGTLQFYTEFSVNTLDTGIYLYEDSSLTTPINVTYVKAPANESYQQLKIFSVDNNGMITFICNQNENC